jgi:hypothetical protein
MLHCLIAQVVIKAWYLNSHAIILATFFEWQGVSAICIVIIQLTQFGRISRPRTMQTQFIEEKQHEIHTTTCH